MTACRGFLTEFLTVLCVIAGHADAASLSVRKLHLTPGEIGTATVEGRVENESTYGLTILVEIVPIGGNRGSVVFTPSPPVDVTQLGDPWPGMGTFSPFDTDFKGLSPTLNGAVDDNGTFVPSAFTYSGLIAGFPIAASNDATGIWEIRLSTSAGESGWEGLATTLENGVITVPGDAIPAVDGWGLALLSVSIITAGTAVLCRRGHG